MNTTTKIRPLRRPCFGKGLAGGKISGRIGLIGFFL
jgi:hypothetical protein